MTKKTKTSAELRAEWNKQKSKADETRKALRAAERREAKERAAAKAAADRRLADALLRRLREAFAEDASDEELTAAMDRLLLCSIGGEPAPEWALHAARRDAAGRAGDAEGM